MKTKLYSSIECARLLGIAHHRIAYAQRMGRLKEASYMVAGKAIFTEADLRKMAKFFEVELKEAAETSDDLGG